jgi:hypothetical protein
MINPPLVSTAVGVVHPARSGMASGINNTFRQVGVATGIAGLGAIFQHQISTKTTAALANAPAAVRGRSSQIVDAFSAGQGRAVAANVPAGMRDTILTSYKTIFSGALDDVLLVAGIVALAGAVAGFVLVRGRDFVGASPSATTEAPAPAGSPAGATAAG